MLLESNRSQSLAWTNSSIVCKVFGPGLMVSRHFTVFVVIRLSQLEKAMTIISARKLMSNDDLIEFRCPFGTKLP